MNVSKSTIAYINKFQWNNEGTGSCFVVYSESLCQFLREKSKEDDHNGIQVACQHVIDEVICVFLSNLVLETWPIILDQ